MKTPEQVLEEFTDKELLECLKGAEARFRDLIVTGESIVDASSPYGRYMEAQQAISAPPTSAQRMEQRDKRWSRAVASQRHEPSTRSMNPEQILQFEAALSSFEEVSRGFFVPALGLLLFYGFLSLPLGFAVFAALQGHSPFWRCWVFWPCAYIAILVFTFGKDEGVLPDLLRWGLAGKRPDWKWLKRSP